MHLICRSQARRLPVALALVLGVGCRTPTAPEDLLGVSVVMTTRVSADSVRLDFEVVNRSTAPVELYGCGGPFASVRIYRADGSVDRSQEFCFGIMILTTQPLAPSATFQGTRTVPAVVGAQYRLGMRFSAHHDGTGDRLSWARPVTL